MIEGAKRFARLHLALAPYERDIMINPSLKFCISIHLALFFTAIVWFMPPGSVARVIDQLNETFEFIFSPVPLGNYYMLKDAAAETIAAQLILIFSVTGIPSYVIGYPLFSRYFSKHS